MRLQLPTTITDENLRILGHLAAVANRLAKDSTGRNRNLAYGIKSSLMSLLIVAGAANANGIEPDATVGVDINVPDLPKVRLHIPLNRLRPDARAIVEQQMTNVPCVSPIADRLRPNQRKELADLCRFQAA